MGRGLHDAAGDVLKGTLDMLILKALELGPMHGWGVSQRIQQISSGVLNINQGSLYPALYRLEDQGWITSEWGASDANRRARFYQLTPSGRARLRDEAARWRRYGVAVLKLFEPA